MSEQIRSVSSCQLLQILSGAAQLFGDFDDIFVQVLYDIYLSVANVEEHEKAAASSLPN